MKQVYLLLALLGLIFPYYFFGSFLVAHGLDMRLLVQQLFANDLSTFFVVDVIISSIVFWIFLYREAHRYQMKHWWLYILVNLVVGVSCALQLFLYFRQSHIEKLGRYD
jgi:hypothetical protein